jgi:hypothetical protein
MRHGRAPLPKRIPLGAAGSWSESSFAESDDCRLEGLNVLFIHQACSDYCHHDVLVQEGEEERRLIADDRQWCEGEEDDKDDESVRQLACSGHESMTIPPNVSGSKANPHYIAATIPLAGGGK